MGAVVHAHHSDRLFACLESGVQKAYHFADVALRFFRAFFHVSHNRGEHLTFSVNKAVAFLCDGEAGHLQGVFFEDLTQTVEVRVILGVNGERFHNTAHNGFLYRAVCF